MSLNLEKFKYRLKSKMYTAEASNDLVNSANAMQSST